MLCFFNYIILSFNSKNPFLSLFILKFKGKLFKIFYSQVTLSVTYHLINFIVNAAVWLQITWFIFTFMSSFALGHTSHSKKVAQGHAGHSLPLIPIINCFLIGGNDSGKRACQIFATPLMNRSALASEPTHLVADAAWWAGLEIASQTLILLGCRGLFWIMTAFLIYQSSCAQKLWMKIKNRECSSTNFFWAVINAFVFN